jgi:CDP-6-deoxy-D-xylo-4-hexulose-3-dehydrase
VIQLGFTPVFCDINLENYSFDLEHLAEIKKAHPDIKIIFITHLLGFSADNELYAKTFPDAVILDDLCESHGCQGPNGVKRGADSLGGTFSFYFGHHITTVEGGMINTNDRELYELMRLKRSHGMAREGDDFADYVKQYPDMHPQFLFMTDGYNFRSSDINAVIGQCQLPRLDNIIEKRKKNLKKFTNIIEANLDKFYPIIWQEGNSNYALPIICRTTEIATRMKAIFDANGVEHRPVVSGNLLHQPFLKGYKFGTPRKNATVDILHNNGVYIGNNHFITDSDLDWLADLLNSI